MSWQAEMRTVLRAMVDDIDSPQAYSDARLEQLLAVAAQFVANEMSFPLDYTADVTAPDISPDPTDRDGGSRNDDFVNLVCLRAACLIDHGKVRRAVGQGIMVKDGSSTIDLRDSAKGYLQLLAKGWCAVYQQAKDEYRAGQTGAGVGVAILGPFRAFAGYGEPYADRPRRYFQ
jgi:hypothetical protein